MSPLSRRVRNGAAFAAAVATGFAGGVVTGVVGSGSAPPRASAGSDVVAEAADRIYADAARALDREDLERAAVQGMLDALGDQWSSYYDPAEFAAFNDVVEGRYSGVGVWLRQEPGAVVVGSVAPGSPADRAGIVAGEVLLQVAGQRVNRVSQAAARLRGDGRLGPVSVLIRGPVGTRVLALDRSRIVTDAVTAAPLPGGVLHLSVAGFSRGVGRQVREALATQAAGFSRGVVLDLRGNPGGLLAEAVEVASAFLDGGPVVLYERRDEGTRTLEALGDGDTDTPLVVLVDEGTASAAEVVAAALQDRNRAIVVGATTFGKGSVQEPTRLSDGSALEITVGRYRSPLGRDIEGRGVAPDVLVAADAAPSAALRRARDVLTGLLAGVPGSGG